MINPKLSDVSLESFVSHFENARPLDWPAIFGREAPLVLEIGCGLGEYLADRAQREPEKNFIGIEIDWRRVKKSLRKMEVWRRRCPGGSPPNVKILQVDVTVALERLFRPRALHHVYCLFPCPWPKKGHVKHRLFSRSFLKLLNSRLAERGEVLVATDFAPFRDWVLGEASGTGFDVRSTVTPARFGTKFERKWAAEGQSKFYELLLRKREHENIPLKEDEKLKVHYVKGFDPLRFDFPDVTGKTSVIGKEFLFDPKQEKAMVRVIVAEEKITQHLWAAVGRCPRGWFVAKADGQTVIPTKGVAKALKLIAQAVKRTAFADDREQPEAMEKNG